MHSLFENWFTELKGVVIGDNRVQTTISQLARSLPPILLTKSWSVPYSFLNINAQSAAGPAGPARSAL